MLSGYTKNRFVEELAMEAPESKGKEYEDHHDDRIDTAPYYEKNCMNFMKMVGLKEVTLNTTTKIFVNTMFHFMMALRTILVKTVLT